MKKAGYLLCISLFFACASTKDLNQFDWLIGSWERTNNTEGTKTYEYWHKNSDTEYIGLGCTLKRLDTVFKEDIRLYKQDNSWNFEVVGANETPTTFKIISKKEGGFTCENKANDFPKTIHYSIQDNTLVAIISDESNEVSFVFKEQQP
ncbi:MAG: DUF6265 family protein [Flavobacteriaceae bacterium]